MTEADADIAERKAARKRRKSEYKKRWYAANKERLLKKFRMYRIIHKERLRQWFRDHLARNKERISKEKQAYRIKNRAILNEKKRRYFQTEKGKLAKLNGLHKRREAVKRAGRGATTKQIQEIKSKSKCCFYCHKKGVKLTIDHVIPLSKGGLHEVNNIVMACEFCNASKGAKSPEDFAKWIGVLII